VTIALTGATGFLGRALLPALLKDGHAVRALHRRTPAETPRGVTWIGGDLHNDDALSALVDGADVVIHVAAAIRGRDFADFDRANRQGTEALLRAAARQPGTRFIHISSLAARAPQLSHYAATKRAAEAAVEGTPDILWTILRPPAVYGPGDMATLPFFRSVMRGIAPRIGGGERPFSLIHVDDLVAAILHLAGDRGLAGQRLELDDGREGGYTLPFLYSVIGEALGKRPLPISVPVPVLALFARLSRMAGRFSATPPLLTPEKLRELTAPDWLVKGPRLSAVSDWRPGVEGEAGLARTALWYREAGWI
jgi:nucleoside-diphosphate-sugar epimerase